MVPALLFALACGIAASAHGASSSTVVTMSVPSTTTITNNCRTTTATAFGTVQPGAAATTATGAGACSISFGSSSDSSALRLGSRDGQGPTMTSPSAMWTNARGNGTPLRGMSRSNATVGFAAGWYGLVMRTMDGGATWVDTWSTGGTGDWFNDVAHAPGSNDAWIIGGGNGMLISTTNGASSAPGNPTWTSHKAALLAAGWPPSQWIDGVTMASASTWFVIGGTRVARTTDSGATFTSYTIPGITQLRDVDAVDTSTVYIAGSNATLLRTTTGGANAAAWTANTTTCGCWYIALSISDATHVYAVSDGGTVIRWDGTAFQAPYWLPQKALEPLDVSSPPSSPNVVFVSTARGYVMRSTDNGATFTRALTPAGGVLDAVAAASASDALAAGSSQRITRTTDGSTWSLVYEDAGRRPLHAVAPHPSDGQRAIAVGAGGTIMRTSDSGATWSSVASGTTQPLFALAWVTNSRVVAVGGGGTVVVSDDAGATWSSRSSGTSLDLHSVAATTDSVVWAGGIDGVLVRSSNRGDAWTTQNSGTGELIDAIAAYDDQRAWAVGDGGAILRTTNGGASWTPAASGPPTWEPITGVGAASASTIYVSTRYSGVWKSTDGGVNFSSLPGFMSVLNTAWDLAVDGTELATIDRWGNVGISHDGGATWNVQYAGASVDMNYAFGIGMVDGHTFYVVDDLSAVEQQDEVSLAAGSIANYGGGATFLTSQTTGAFGVCVQSLAAATIAAGWAVDGGTCLASDSDPWRAVPTAPATIATAASGVSGTATFVWGFAPKASQAPGTYRAGVVFETIAPAA